MPPSPALKIPDLIENHKRGRSVERRSVIDDKEDDLALFNEVKNKGRDSYLLQSNCDFDYIFSTKIKQLSDHKAGFSTGAGKESGDLLAAVDKNDYDWLLTPPESPLFPSLDDDRVALRPEMRGRTRSQTLQVSQASKVEKGCRNVRGSPSRRFPSPSPRSSNTKVQSRSRPSSASHSSPPSAFLHTSPSRRLSPSPGKLKKLAVRSGSLTPRRVSTGSASATQANRGTSPVNVSRGSSASPKTRGWPSNIPWFSCEAPPNLCTSLADRPGPYVRGFTPASRNSRSGRQSMSPTASRSVSSSISREMDPCCSYSKGSVASSRDDDMDSIPFSCSDYSVQQNVCALPNNRSSEVFKKPTIVFSSSASKRHSDLALRQVDKKGPQNMFRPLMSSVPSATFYVGKEGTPSRSLASRNSSIITSNNTSSDYGTSRALDAKKGDEDQGDMSSNFLRQRLPNAVEEVFAMDAAEDSMEDVCSVVTANPEKDDSPPGLAITGSSRTALVDSVVNIDGASSMELCCRCQRKLYSAELVTEGDQRLCRKCRLLVSTPSFIPEETTTSEACSSTIDNSTRRISLDILEHMPISQAGATNINHFESNSVKGQSPAPSAAEEPELCIEGDEPCHEEKLVGDFYLSSKFDIHEVEGLSLLLKRPCGAQGHIIGSRSCTASNTSYDDLSYMRDSLTSLRSSVGRSSVSALSSFDLVSYKSSEVQVHEQRRVQNSDTEDFRCGETSPHKCSISLSLEDGLETVTKNKSNGVGGVRCHETHEQSLNSESTNPSTPTHKGSGVIYKAIDSGVSFSISEEPSQLEKENKWSGNSQDLAQEETSTSKLHVCSLEGDTPRSSICDAIDAKPEVRRSGALNNVSEVELRTDDTHILQSDFDSTKSTSPDEQPPVSVTENCFYEDTTRSLTLEEATDVILVCSSIVQDIAYNAASMAINDGSSEVGLPLTTPFPSKTICGKEEIGSGTLGRRRSKSHKAQKRELEMEQRSPQSVLAENEGKSTPRIVLSPASMSNSSMPPKLVSKCNCAIM